MVTYTIGARSLAVARNAVFIDTNVLVGGFVPGDQHEATAKSFLDNAEEPFVIPIAVVVEAWGMIVGSYGRPDCGLRMLAWLSDPGHADLVALPEDRLDRCRSLIEQLEIDLVDAVLACLVDEISKAGNFEPAPPIATFDTKHFVRCRSKGLQNRVWDLRSNDKY